MDAYTVNCPLPTDDLRRIVEQVGEETWQTLDNAEVYITGAAGFVGRWMLESVREANMIGNVWPVAKDAENWWPKWKPTHIIHATTDGVGWQHVAAVARAAGARMLLLSSGAVYATYGGTLRDGKSMDEEWPPRRPDVNDKYATLKLIQENECRDVAVIARLFTFIGPGLRRHTGREFLEADPITVDDDGAVRSYLYASDMAAACWLALLRGQVGRAYNVGSDKATRVVDFADKCWAARECKITVNESGQNGTYYVPDVSRAERELGCRQTVGLDDAIRRTLAWQKS